LRQCRHHYRSPPRRCDAMRKDSFRHADRSAIGFIEIEHASDAR
jgi:hypothetical protein